MNERKSRENCSFLAKDYVFRRRQKLERYGRIYESVCTVLYNYCTHVCIYSYVYHMVCTIGFLGGQEMRLDVEGEILIRVVDEYIE